MPRIQTIDGVNGSNGVPVVTMCGSRQPEYDSCVHLVATFTAADGTTMVHLTDDQPERNRIIMSLETMKKIIAAGRLWLDNEGNLPPQVIDTVDGMFSIFGDDDTQAYLRVDLEELKGFFLDDPVAGAEMVIMELPAAA